MGGELIFEPTDTMAFSLKSIAVFLTLILLVSLPFSIALNSISLGLMALWVVYVMLAKPESRKSLTANKIRIVWLVIPLFYGISILYSNEFTRAINQWLILAPLLILPPFFSLFDLTKTRENWIKCYVLVILLVGLIQWLSAQGYLTLVNKEPGMVSVFYDSEKHSFIIWSAILLAGWYNPNSRFWVWTTPVLFLNLFYYGHISLILITGITYLVMQLKIAENALSLVIPRALIFGTAIFIFSLVYFSTFRTQLSEALFNIVAVYTREAWTKQAIDYLSDLKFSFAQWLKHPFTGVGLGDYVDAIWNEYHDHGLEAPEDPRSQFMHFLVSAGLSGLAAFYIIMSSWRKSGCVVILYLILASSVLFIAAPFKSQVSASAFMIAVLLLPSPNE